MLFSLAVTADDMRHLLACLQFASLAMGTLQQTPMTRLSAGSVTSIRSG
jgi:hypothetical protein